MLVVKGVTSGLGLSLCTGRASAQHPLALHPELTAVETAAQGLHTLLKAQPGIISSSQALLLAASGRIQHRQTGPPGRAQPPGPVCRGRNVTVRLHFFLEFSDPT